MIMCLMNLSVYSWGSWKKKICQKCCSKCIFHNVNKIKTQTSLSNTVYWTSNWNISELDCVQKGSFSSIKVPCISVMVPALSCLLLILKQNGFFRNLGNNKQPHLQSTLAWICSMNLWIWSCLVCLRSQGSFQGRLFGLCAPWCVCLLQSLVWSSGDKTANTSLRITELERASEGPLSRPLYPGRRICESFKTGGGRSCFCDTSRSGSPDCAKVTVWEECAPNSCLPVPCWNI